MPRPTKNSHGFPRSRRYKLASRENDVVSSLIDCSSLPCVLGGRVEARLLRSNIRPQNDLTVFWATVGQVYPFYCADDEKAWPFAFERSLHQRM